jgi:hypothetical protein
VTFERGFSVADDSDFATFMGVVSLNLLRGGGIESMGKD